VYADIVDQPLLYKRLPFSGRFDPGAAWPRHPEVLSLFLCAHCNRLQDGRLRLPPGRRRSHGAFSYQWWTYKRCPYSSHSPLQLPTAFLYFSFASSQYSSCSICHTVDGNCPASLLCKAYPRVTINAFTLYRCWMGPWP